MTNLKKVETLIEVNLRSKKVSLNLCNCGLTGNEEALKQPNNATYLEKLNLSCNPMTDYSFIQELKKIQSFDLSFNKLIDIPFLKGLKQLQYSSF